VGAGPLGGLAGPDDLLIGQGRGLDDHLEHHGARGCLAHGPDLGPGGLEIARADQAHVDAHVDLVGAVGHRLGGRGGRACRGLPAASRTARTSAAAASRSPERTRPTLMTMSASSAPLETDSAASAALIAEECWPEGKPQTVATLTVVSTGSIDGERHTE